MGGVGKTSLAITRGRGGPMAAKALPSFTPRAWAAARTTPKQSLKKSALIMACVVGLMVRCGALFRLFFYFKTGANKLVDLIADQKVALGELLIYVVAWISVPNESDDFEKNLAVSPKDWVTCLQKRKRRAPHSRIF
jgi:hypothetical protein